MSTAPPPVPPYSSEIATPSHPSSAILRYSSAWCWPPPARCSRVPHSRRQKSRMESTNARRSSLVSRVAMPGTLPAREGRSAPGRRAGRAHGGGGSHRCGNATAGGQPPRRIHAFRRRRTAIRRVRARTRSARRLVDRDHRRAAQPDVVLQRALGVVDLALVGLAAQLPRQLAALREAGRSERMALGDQPARRVDDPLAAVRRRLLVDELVALALLGQPERL